MCTSRKCFPNKQYLSHHHHLAGGQFPYKLVFHFCIFTAHTCNLALQGCKMARNGLLSYFKVAFSVRIRVAEVWRRSALTVPSMTNCLMMRTVMGTSSGL